jgi:hypothetical protein
VGRLSELTGAQAYGSGAHRVRFYEQREIRKVDGLTIVGVLR